MAKIRFSKVILFAMTSGLFIFSLLFFVSNHRGLSEQLTAWPALVADRFGSFVRAPGEWVEDLSSDVKELLETYEENTKLKKRLVVLENQERLIKELEEDNNQLRQQLKLSETFSSSQLIGTRVIARSTLAWLDVVTVDKGTKDQVVPKMFLVSEKGLVGVVNQVTEESSQVMLLTHSGAQFPLAVKISDDNDWVYGIVLGYDQEKEALKVGQFNRQVNLEAGAEVLTSGLDGESLADVPIGEVMSLNRASDQSLVAYLSLVADRSDLSQVHLIGRPVDAD